MKKIMMMIGLATTAMLLAGCGQSQQSAAPAAQAPAAQAVAKADATGAADFVPVESSLLEKVKYNPDTKILTVKLLEGQVYEYHEVPNEIYKALMDAESKGKYFVSSIKDKFETKKLSE